MPRKKGTVGMFACRGTFVVLVAATVLSALLGPGGPRASPAGEEQSLKLDPSLIALDSPQGRRLLRESRANQSYVPLSMYFTTQDKLTYCGVASACMVLNATGVERPVSPEHKPYRLFTQANFFTPKVREVIAPEEVGRSGMPLKALGDVLRTYPVKVEVVFASDKRLDAFRKEAVGVLASQDSYLVVNYLRKAIKQESGGHISPVAAYHEGEDRFLIMDVARYKYPPVWVKADQLWGAMSAVDDDSGTSRGYVVVRPRGK